jgi:ribosomal protein S18 acetylase RimI-like enzyme
MKEQLARDTSGAIPGLENMGSMRSRIERISKAYMHNNMTEFCSIEFNWADIGERPWNESNFLLELPRKWDLSFAIKHGKRVVGYIIGSKESDKRAKVNKIVVDKSYRRKGLGRKLIHNFEKSCLATGLCEVELKALTENLMANKFYVELGYELSGCIEGSDRKIRNVYFKRLK